MEANRWFSRVFPGYVLTYGNLFMSLDNCDTRTHFSRVTQNDAALLAGCFRPWKVASDFLNSWVSFKASVLITTALEKRAGNNVGSPNPDYKIGNAPSRFPLKMFLSPLPGNLPRPTLNVEWDTSISSHAPFLVGQSSSHTPSLFMRLHTRNHETVSSLHRNSHKHRSIEKACDWNSCHSDQV
jgi:hypothetical protein